MSRRLLLLDLLLIALVCLAGWQLRRETAAENAREQALWNTRVNPKGAVPLPPLAQVVPLTAMTYADVAQLNLFSVDRNPQAILDPVKPPAPPPVPPFPVARGVMLWEGAPPTVVLSEKSGGPQKGYHPGDRIGEWKVVSVDNQYLALEWNGQQFKKRLDELMDRTPLVQEAPAPQQTQSNSPAPAKSIQNLGDSPKPGGPGVDVGGDTRMCTPGDNTPVGTVQDGYRKVSSQTPFGASCRWEKVK